MIYEVGRTDILDQLPPREAPKWICGGSNGIEVAGDRVEYRETFVWHDDNRALISTDIGEILAHLTSGPMLPAASPFGISQVLNHGFTPVPHTAIEGIVRLAGGDTVTLVVEDDKIESSVSSEYPWLARLSRQDLTADPAELGRLIAASVDDRLAATQGDTLLMLSSGKDSTSLAIALAAGGHTDVECYTFTSRPTDTEHVFAAGTCTRLGLQHHTVSMPENPTTTRAALLKFFERAPLPSADPATIPYAIITHMVGLESGGIMDGCGNDGYMGYLPSGHIRMRNNLRIRNRSVARLIQNMIQLDSRANYFTRSKAAAFIPGRMFRDRETRRFYADAQNTEDFWYKESRSAAELDLVDFVAATEVRHTDPARSNNKVHLAAHASGLTAILPFCDEPIADYCFNLPEADRFDRSGWTSKLLLRQHLAQTIDYDPVVAGSHYFAVDGASFLLANHAFVRDEVLSCELWGPELAPLFDGWMKALPNRRFLFHALLALFMISGWHNHFPLVNKSRASM